jgi:hypothetical protein
MVVTKLSRRKRFDTPDAESDESDFETPPCCDAPGAVGSSPGPEEDISPCYVLIGALPTPSFALGSFGSVNFGSDVSRLTESDRLTAHSRDGCSKARDMVSQGEYRPAIGPAQWNLVQGFEGSA